MSLWSLGEVGGFPGNELDTRNITCPFCLERGVFSWEHHAAKRKPNTEKFGNYIRKSHYNASLMYRNDSSLHSIN